MTPRDRAQCRDVNRRGGLFIAVAAAALTIPAAASAATGPPTLDLSGPKSPGLLDRVNAVGQLPGADAAGTVTVTVEASGRTVEKKQINVGADGKYSFPFLVNACCRYEVTATSGGKSSPPQRFSVRVPKHLRKRAITRLYNQSLVAQGYYIGRNMSSRFTRGSQLATAAFRKVNGMARNMQYKPVIFRKLLMGRGAFQPRYRSGHHVEVDLSRQVMALVNGDNVVATVHADRPWDVPLLPQGAGHELARDVHVRVLHRRLCDPRLPLGSDARGREPRLRAEPGAFLGLHLQLDPPRRPNPRLPVGRCKPSSGGILGRATRSCTSPVHSLRRPPCVLARLGLRGL